MMNDTRTDNPIHRSAARRGNTMILVAGILALLVVIAAAYITRTQGGRITATAVQQSETRDNNAHIIADSLAEEVAGALFASPVDPNLGPGYWWVPSIARSDAPRLPLAPDAVRYSIDRDRLDNEQLANNVFVFNADGLPDYPYNFAPYSVVPFTNWPDEPTLGGGVWPKGPGALNGFAPPGLYEGNPVGNPGFGDARWLRDTEPLRWNTSPHLPPDPPLPPNRFDDTFKYWRHLTYLARPNNGFRQITDISEVGGVAAVNMNYPVEQWLSSYIQPGPAFNTNTGDALYPGDDLFWQQWFQWFYNYPAAYIGTLLPPPHNFYHLNDLNANGIPLEAGERPQDEFVRDTPRWNVSRILTDTDGDGYTDAFWFVAPTPIERGIRQIVAVSIVDNSALANVNVATRFRPGDPLGATEPFATAGETPSDLALVGQQLPYDTAWGWQVPGNWNVGFFDSFQNWERWFFWPAGLPGQFPLYGSDGEPEIQWYGAGYGPAPPNDDNRWRDFLTETGIRLLNGNWHPSFPNELTTTLERRWYWLYSASRPFSASLALTPFTLADELELRMYHGQNYPWILSRFERAVNTDDPQAQYAFLRSPRQFEECSPYLDQLNNSELMHDNRRKLTVYNGARNDELPPWLWWRWRNDADPSLIDYPAIVDFEVANNPFQDVDGNGVNDIIDRFLLQARRRLDLREMSPDLFVPPLGMRYLHQRLPWMLLNAFADGDEAGQLFGQYGTQGGSYFGPYSGTDDATELRELAAAFTANILAYRDADADAPLVDDPNTPSVLEIGAIPLPEWEQTAPEDDSTRYLGMERQPFLLEAFIGHIYEPEMVTPPPGQPGWLNNGAPILLSTQDWDLDGNDETVSPDKTILIVQIANPYDQPVILASENPNFPYDYQLKVLGRPAVSLSTIVTPPGFVAPAADLDGDGFEDYFLPPARENFPTTMIVYSIPYSAVPGSDGDRIRGFFDLMPADHPSATNDFTMIVDLTEDFSDHSWDVDRSEYDGLITDDPADTIQLIRRDKRNDSPVVIDRMDGPKDDPGDPFDPDFKFLEGVVAMGDDANMLPTWDDLGVIPPPDGTDYFPVPPGQPSGDWSHYIQWRGAVRAWGRDKDGDWISDPDEINPRYISARKEVRKAETTENNNPPLDQRPTYYVDGNVFDMDANPDDDGTGWPWFTVVIGNMPGGQANYSRKPTFFNMNHEHDGAFPNWSYPDKGDQLLNGTNAYYSNYSLQMLQKDGDFQQVGELLDVWLYGHKLAFMGGLYDETVETFSERIRREQEDPSYGGDDVHVNRLRPGGMVGVDPDAGDWGNAYDPLQAVPAVPAGVRVLDAFVCDGPGVNYNPNPPYNHVADHFFFNNAMGFGGHLTPGLVNINTALLEVLRTVPQWDKIVHNNPSLNLPGGGVAADLTTRSAVPEALIAYRERFDHNHGGFGFGMQYGPDYSDRDISGLPDIDISTHHLRPERGLASIGEIKLLLNMPELTEALGTPYFGPGFTIWPDAWSSEFAAKNPFELEDTQTDVKYGAYLSTDVIGYNPDITDFVGDGVADDAEEANLLLAGASNLITTRSDVFTVYFRIRSFRQNPHGPNGLPVWDATDPEYIVDDSRYVMLVDRSEVNHPTDKPKILYMEKLPN